MELTYWTTLLEPKSCVKGPYECDLDQYIPRLEGDLTIKNVSVSRWKDEYVERTDNDRLEMRLAFSQEVDVTKKTVFSIGPTSIVEEIPKD